MRNTAGSRGIRRQQQKPSAVWPIEDNQFQSKRFRLASRFQCNWRVHGVTFPSSGNQSASSGTEPSGQGRTWPWWRFYGAGAWRRHFVVRKAIDWWVGADRERYVTSIGVNLGLSIRDHDNALLVPTGWRCWWHFAFVLVCRLWHMVDLNSLAVLENVFLSQINKNGEKKKTVG